MITVYPEMVQAGCEAYWEARKNRLSDEEIVAVVFLAMRMVEAIADMQPGEVVH